MGAPFDLGICNAGRALGVTGLGAVRPGICSLSDRPGDADKGVGEIDNERPEPPDGLRLCC